MSTRGPVDAWTERLTGLSPKRISESREWIESLGSRRLSAELARPDIDAAAGSCMLLSAFEELSQRGVQQTKLEAKLRNDAEVWPSVTELIAVSVIARNAAPSTGIELDAYGESGRRPDLRLRFSDGGPPLTTEFKAVGLSDREAELFSAAAEVLPEMAPAFGVGTQHISADAHENLYAPTRAERRAQELENRRIQKRLPAHIRGLNGAAVAAHYTEEAYLIRTRDKVLESLSQLPASDECWVAIWWSNGAPVSSMQQLLETVDLPAHVRGIILVGAAVVVPDPEIHYFQIIIPRDDVLREDTPSVVSEEEHPFAEVIFGQLEQSTGVRPTLIVHPRGPRPKRQRLLFRDGSRRIFPFNLLIGPDPPGVRELVVFKGSPEEERRRAAELLREGEGSN